MIVAEYTRLRCMRGVMRAEPHDFTADGTWNPTDGFMWELERELGGNLLANKYLAPFMVTGD
jgi:predicted secreted protein